MFLQWNDIFSHEKMPSCQNLNWFLVVPQLHVRRMWMEGMVMGMVIGSSLHPADCCLLRVQSCWYQLVHQYTQHLSLNHWNKATDSTGKAELLQSCTVPACMKPGIPAPCPALMGRSTHPPVPTVRVLQTSFSKYCYFYLLLPHP